MIQDPYDPLYYQAVVRVERSARNYKELARDKALRSIAMQISTTIEAEINVSEREAWGVMDSEYLSTLRATSSASIRDLQLKDSFTTGKDYYALYRLNKAEYQAQRAIEARRAVNSSVELYRKFLDPATELAHGIPLLLKALDNLVNYPDMELVYDDGRNIYNDLQSSLQALGSELCVTFEEDRIATKARLSQTQYARASVLHRGTACPNISLICGFDEGEGLLSSSLITDRKGESLLEIRRVISSQSPQRIRLEIDKNAFINDSYSSAVKRMWESVHFSPAYLTLDVSQPLIYLDYSFIASYQNGLRDNVANQLANLQLGVATRLDEADYLLEVRIFAKKGEHLDNLNYYTSYGDIHLSLKDPKRGSTVNYLEKLNFKSGGNSREKAERAVEQDAVKMINDGLLYRLLYDALLD
ncbi:MAG TPA: LPP20 family lipoprotein [Candidatus Cloacimonadota bacterium]|nr:LPP20 family lipoprotein [Candidatus Cloacimonadota bacterium]